MKDGKKIVYFSNGNIIVKQSGLITTVNGKGQRVKKSQEVYEQAESLQIKNYFDIETCKIMAYFRVQSVCEVG